MERPKMCPTIDLTFHKRGNILGLILFGILTKLNLGCTEHNLK